MDGAFRQPTRSLSNAGPSREFHNERRPSMPTNNAETTNAVREFANAVLGRSVAKYQGVASPRDNKQRRGQSGAFRNLMQADLLSETAASACMTETVLFAESLLNRQPATRSSPPSRRNANSELVEFCRDISSLTEARWDASKHPRGANPQNRGQFSTTGGIWAAGARQSAYIHRSGCAPATNGVAMAYSTP